MSDDQSPGGWWKTLPGVLTAIAALLTAVVGGVVGLKQAGIILETVPPPAQGSPIRSESTETRRVEPKEAHPSETKVEPQPPRISSVPPLSVTPALDQVQVAKAVYQILTTTVEPYDAEQVRLQLAIRLTSLSPYGHNFWGRSFRLLVDSIPRAPDNDLNEVVQGESAKEGMVSFIFPKAAHSLVLRISSGDEHALIPLQLGR